MTESKKIREFVQFHIDTNVKHLYKGFLVSLEDLKNNNIISNESYQLMRKKVLDSGNSCLREITSSLDKVDFTLR